MTNHHRYAGTAVDADHASTADLVKLAGEQVSRLVREEVALARAEMTVKAKRAGTGAGLFGTAGVLTLYGVAALLATAIIALDLVLPLWLSALIVGVVLLIVAAVMALVGRRQVREAAPPLPERAVSGVRADVHTVSEAFREGHR
jgi:VIT1/CCC1 family predicted Fe2+/Mn2+ transporter